MNKRSYFDRGEMRKKKINRQVEPRKYLRALKRVREVNQKVRVRERIN